MLFAVCTFFLYVCMSSLPVINRWSLVKKKPAQIWREDKEFKSSCTIEIQYKWYFLRLVEGGEENQQTDCPKRVEVRWHTKVFAPIKNETAIKKAYSISVCCCWDVTLHWYRFSLDIFSKEKPSSGLLHRKIRFERVGWNGRKSGCIFIVCYARFL